MGLNEKTYVFYVDVNKVFRGQLEPILVTVQGECPLGENGDREDMITAPALEIIARTLLLNVPSAHHCVTALAASENRCQRGATSQTLSDWLLSSEGRVLALARSLLLSLCCF